MKALIKLTVFLFVLFSFTNCTKKKINNDALIIGIDYRKCAHPLCGGYFIEINQDTLRFLNIPEKSDLGELEFEKHFPIPVEVKWILPKDKLLKKAADLIEVKELNRK